MDDVQLDYGGLALNPVEAMFVKATHAGADVRSDVVRRVGDSAGRGAAADRGRIARAGDSAGRGDARS